MLASFLSGTASLDGLNTGLTAPGGAAGFCFVFVVSLLDALTGFGSPNVLRTVARFARFLVGPPEKAALGFGSGSARF